MTFRIHEPIVMPGIFQTEAYYRRILAFWYPFLDAPDDADAVVAAARAHRCRSDAEQTRCRGARRAGPAHPIRAS
jgi:hypothetical protein